MFRAGLLVVALLASCSHTKVITIRQTIHEPAPKPEIPCIEDVNGGACGNAHPFDTLRET